MINWPQFLINHHIEYVTNGPNTARNNVSINCPYCQDPSHHLGISLEGKGWSCWRCHNHGGSVKLIQKLIHCDWETACQIAGVQTTVTVSDVTLTSYVKGLMTKEHKAQERRQLQIPPEFRRFLSAHRSLNPCYDYLHTRGYNNKECFLLAENYEIYFSFSGIFAYRIIFPVYNNIQLVTWTGRAIGKSNIRYKTLSNDAEKAKKEGTPQAIESIKDCWWNYPALINDSYNTLMLTEGPFDALKLDFFGSSLGVRSTCMFGKSISEAQSRQLDSIHNRINHLYIVLDADSELEMTKITQQLSHLNCKIKRLPKGVKDPGSMTREQIKEWL